MKTHIAIYARIPDARYKSGWRAIEIMKIETTVLEPGDILAVSAIAEGHTYMEMAKQITEEKNVVP